MKRMFHISLTDPERDYLVSVLYNLMTDEELRVKATEKRTRTDMLVRVHEKAGASTPTIKFAYPSDKIQKGVKDLLSYVDHNGSEYRAYVGSLDKRDRQRIKDSVSWLKNLMRVKQ